MYPSTEYLHHHHRVHAKACASCNRWEVTGSQLGVVTGAARIIITHTTAHYLVCATGAVLRQGCRHPFRFLIVNNGGGASGFGKSQRQVVHGLWVVGIALSRSTVVVVLVFVRFTAGALLLEAGSGFTVRESRRC